MPHPAPAGQPLTLFNSLTRAPETFVPIDPAMVRLYSCGPTVYNFAHLGNLRAYVFTDTLRRVLNWKGYATNHVINITDVGHLTSDADEGDDKMELAAKAAARTIWEVAAFYTEAFKGDLTRLNIRPPTLWSVATDHIQDMIAFARDIERAGSTYELPSGLYFDTASVSDYGRLAGTKPDETIARIDTVEGKRNPADFAIWRRSPKDSTRQMEWASPWGVGAPGWHLECSVMSLKYLGAQFDIHTGGIDHREIHHCNEIAQNQAFTGGGIGNGTGANIWMHNNFLIAKEKDGRGGKMSKSKGGFATLQSLVDRGVHPLAYRLLCLSSHYRSELEFSGETLLAARTRLKRLLLAIGKVTESADGEVSRLLGETDYSRGASLGFVRESLERDLGHAAREYLKRFDGALSDDLMTPVALTVLDEMLADKRLDKVQKMRVLASMDLALGLDLVGAGALSVADLRIRADDAVLTDEQVEGRLADRRAARAAKDFAASDTIRDELAIAGIEIMDGDPLGWEWKLNL